MNIYYSLLAVAAGGVLLASRALAQDPQWADYGQSNTIILVNQPRGEHKVLIEVVDPEGKVFTAQTARFTSPGK